MPETPGQRRTGHVVDMIDGAISDYTSPDAMRWSPDHEDVKPAHVGAHSLSVLDESHPFDGEMLRRAFAEFGRAVQCWLAPYGERIRELARIAAVVEPDPEPVDPMERALWLRRNRNTGPAKRQRAPRRIDPGRSR